MTDTPPTYVVTADTGDGPEPDPDERYDDLAFAWKMADELQDEAEAGVVYGVYALTAAERP